MENGRTQLYIVPSLWEMGGAVKWPKKGSGHKIFRDLNAIPRSDWSTKMCVVKRKDLPSYDAAKIKLRSMLKDNDIITQQIQQDYSTGNTSRSRPKDTYMVVEETPELHNQSILFDITKQIMENQKEIMVKLANVPTQAEDSFQGIDMVDVSTLLRESRYSEKLKIKVITQEQELEDFERLLEDDYYKSNLIKSYAMLCSGGEGLGTNCAYKFIDLLFSREFMCKCSWSGGTRSEGVKIGLKQYKRTINFFFEMIQQWDPTYTLDDVETFLKIILRNSTKRTACKFLRTSVKRNRKKGKSVAPQEIYGEAEQEKNARNSSTSINTEKSDSVIINNSNEAVHSEHEEESLC